MKICGLDIASKTGFSILEDGNLKNYGMINIPQEMNLFQRLSFFENNINQILDTYKPDFIALEDVLLGISGVKTLAYLSRLNGIALLCCYKRNGNNIKLFMPGEWKSNSFEGLNGNSKKVEVQIAVCKHFKLLNETELITITKPLSTIDDKTEELQIKRKEVVNEANKHIAYISRKKIAASISIQEKKAFDERIKKLREMNAQLKEDIKNVSKTTDKILSSVSIEITSRCGLTCDVSDSIGIAYCAYKNIYKNIINNQKDISQ